MRQWSGQSRLRITVEGHGREDLFEAIDTTETVGWFTTTYPLALQSEDGGISAVIKAVKEQYRAVPRHGIGCGALRHLAGDEALKSAEAANPPILLFNYLGQFDQTMATDSVFALAAESTGDAIGSTTYPDACAWSERPWWLEVCCVSSWTIARGSTARRR